MASASPSNEGGEAACAALPGTQADAKRARPDLAARLPTVLGDLPLIEAPDDWRRIDFISDLHLQAQAPRTAQAFLDYMQACQADALFILGDWFEVWVGDDMREMALEGRCLEAVATYARQHWVGVMVGNRDFLLGQQALQACGAHPIADPSVLAAHGQRAVLTHGDAWCLDDVRYQQFRAQVRQPMVQQAFLSQDLAARLRQAQAMRAGSASQLPSGSSQALYDSDVDEGTARAHLQAAQAQWLIHGHTHRPCKQAFAGGQRWVLSDWDLHAQPARAMVLSWTAEGFAHQAPDGLTD